ncbi:MAG: hypothetical protein EXR71_12795 [Myxococcales bacterium]|nr:hypothetical protein [Myxococcales bacterium]
MMLFALGLACLTGDETHDSDGSGDTDTGAGGGDTGWVFDTACALQVMRVQTVCECGSVTVDWSRMSMDGYGEPFDPERDVALVHSYIIDQPESGVANLLCSGAPIANDVIDPAGGVVLPNDGQTSAEMDLDGEWTFQTGVIAMYDSESNDSKERAAIVFVFDEAATSDKLVFEGRGDVWGAP